MKKLASQRLFLFTQLLAPTYLLVNLLTLLVLTTCTTS